MTDSTQGKVEDDDTDNDTIGEISFDLTNNDNYFDAKLPGFE